VNDDNVNVQYMQIFFLNLFYFFNLLLFKSIHNILLHMNVSNVNDQLYKIKKIGKIKIKLITFCVFAKIYRINQFGQKTCITP